MQQSFIHFIYNIFITCFLLICGNYFNISFKNFYEFCFLLCVFIPLLLYLKYFCLPEFKCQSFFKTYIVMLSFSISFKNIKNFRKQRKKLKKRKKSILWITCNHIYEFMTGHFYFLLLIWHFKKYFYQFFEIFVYFDHIHLLPSIPRSIPIFLPTKLHVLFFFF